MRKIAKRCFVIGLDSAPPQFVFDEYKEDIPNLSKLMGESAYGDLESCVPPITVPAWTCMMTGKNPGHHGCFGFRNRKPGTYGEGKDLWIATNKVIREKRVWDILSEAGKRVCTLGVPQTFPPRPINGVQVAGFLTPDTHDCHYCEPPEVAEDIK
jgi:predicted AlkP superfamily phosphohydrolase/phosphomutase